MTKGGKIVLGYIVGILCIIFSVYGLAEDALYQTGPRSWLNFTLIFGVVFLALAILTQYFDRQKQKEAAEAAAKKKAEEEAVEAQRKKDAEDAAKARDARIRQELEAESEELDRLLDGPYKVNVYRLTHCVSPSVQDRLALCYEDQKVRFTGDDDDDSVIWIVDKYDERLGRLPKDAAARYLEEGAAGVYIKSLEDEDGNVIPYVRVFWRAQA